MQDPQVVTGSHDTTIKFWDLRYGNMILFITMPFIFASVFSLHFCVWQERQWQLWHTIRNLFGQWHCILKSMILQTNKATFWHICFQCHNFISVFGIYIFIIYLFIYFILFIPWPFSRHSFASASADNIKKFNLPRGEFVHNMLWVL